MKWLSSVYIFVSLVADWQLVQDVFIIYHHGVETGNIKHVLIMQCWCI